MSQEELARQSLQALDLYKQRKLPEAAALYERILPAEERIHGTAGIKTATLISDLATIYYEMGQYAKAEPLYQRALSIRESRLGAGHIDVANSLANLGVLYSDLGQYAKAVPLLVRSLNIREAGLGKDHPDVAISLYRLASTYRSMGQYAKAEPLYRRSVEMVEAKLGKDHPSLAFCLSGLADLYHDMRQYPKAEPLYERALSIRESRLGADHTDVANSLNDLGLLYRDMKQYPKAVPLLQRCLNIRENRLGKDHLTVANSLNNLAHLFGEMGQNARAAPLLLRCLNIREAQLGKDHPDVAEALNNLATTYAHTGQHAQAEPLYERSLQIREARFGKEDLRVASTLSSLANSYAVTGDYNKAEPLFLRSLRIREARLGEDDLSEAVSLNWLANLYFITGRVTKVEPLYQRSLQIYQNKLGKDHPEVAVSLNNLAILYQYNGQYAKAEPLFVRSLHIREARLGKDHPDVATSLNNLALLYHYNGQHAKPEPLYQRSLQIREAGLGPNHPDVAVSLNNLALWYQHNGQYAQAEPLYARSLQIDQTRFGKDHPSMAPSLHNLASLYRDLGQYAKAETLFLDSLRIKEANLGKSHPGVVDTLSNLAWNSAAQKEWTRAVDRTDKARKGIAYHLAEVLPTLSEREQLTLLQANFEPAFHRALSLGWTARKQASAASAEWLLNGQAMAHQSLAEQQILARDARDPRARQLVDRLQETRSRLAAHINRTPQPGQVKAYQQDMQDLRASEQDLAQKLARAVGRAYRANPWVTLDDLRARLGPKTAFVDMARFAVFDFENSKWSGPRYVAWITPPAGQGAVQLIDLGAAEPIDQLVDKTRKTLIDSAKTVSTVGEPEAFEAVQKPLHAVSAQVLHPLLPALEKFEEWIVCPDGALWLLPWHALVLPKGEFAVEKHVIRHVVSGRDLVLELPKAQAHSAYIFADPDYDLSPSQVKALAGQLRAPAHEDLRDATVVHRSLPKVPRLPGTGVEAEAIRPRLQQWLGQDPKIFTDGMASETLVKAVKNPRVLILATHGYFLPAQEVDVKDLPGLEVGLGKSAAPLLDKKGQPIENPLLRCGLLLAGCNRRADAKPGEDDGILTGLEIVGMDLSGCQLIVLSACETGLGDVRSGEGVAGLRQAFQLAGAKGVLASLWQVPDRETALLMNAFYGELAKGRSQTQALRQAQLQRITARRGQFGAAHPFFWSAFALTTRDNN